MPMTTTFSRLIEGSLLTTSAVAYYTAPAGTSTVLKKVTFTNTSGDTATITVYLVRSGGSTGAQCRLIDTRTLSSQETYDCIEAIWHILAPGDSLQAQASAGGAVNIIASGVETK